MGEVFAGRYELVDPIGRGGAGAVWRSWDHRRKRYVAAKVLLHSDAHTLLRFVREQALRIDHPHVLAPTSWAADDEKVLFTMDLVSGGSLAHLIGDYGPLPPVFVCTLLDQLLAGLSAVHAEDVVHRDIKPANILLEATGAGRPHLRLSDFGISMRKGEPRLTETHYVVGTPGYFAPEQLLGAEPDFTADLYATGLVALYMLTGRKPDSEALTASYALGTPGPPQGIPEPLWGVLSTLLQPNPEVRFRTAVGVRKALMDSVELLKGHPDEPGAPCGIEVSDHLGPLPPGYGPNGPLSTAAETQSPSRSGVPGSPTPSSASGASGARPPASDDSYHLAPPPGVLAGAQTGYPAPDGYGYPAPDGYGYPQQAAPAPSSNLGHRTGQGGHPTMTDDGKVRSGPSSKVVAPVLVLALILIAVGVWALSQS